MALADKLPERLILIGGAPLVGKSTLAARLARHFSVPWVSSDDIRKWMQQLVRTEDFPFLFDSVDISAEAFYKRYDTVQKVIVRQRLEHGNVQSGISAMIRSFWWWDDYIIEGIAVTPAFVNHLQTSYLDIRIESLFLVDHQEDSISRRLRTRGLWDEAGAYSPAVRPHEQAYVTAANREYEREAKKFGYPLYDVAMPDMFQRIMSDL